MILRTLILWMLPVALYAASITVNPLTVVFDDPTTRHHDVRVFNTGEETAYVNVMLSKIHHPGTEAKELEPMQANPVIFGLVANPNKLIIPVGQSRLVRVMRLVRNNDQDVVYQLKIVPVTGAMQAVKDTDENVVAGIRVVVGYNVAVRVLPDNPQPIFKAERQGQKATLKNEGNTSILLTDGEQCLKEACEELKVKRLYAGNTWAFDLPYDAPFSYLKTTLEQSETIVVQ